MGCVPKKFKKFSTKIPLFYKRQRYNYNICFFKLHLLHFTQLRHDMTDELLKFRPIHSIIIPDIIGQYIVRSYNPALYAANET